MDGLATAPSNTICVTTASGSAAADAGFAGNCFDSPAKRAGGRGTIS